MPIPQTAHAPCAWADARLAELGRSASAWIALPAEASHRRFYRSVGGILMTSPPALEQNGQFVHMARLLRDHGIGAPAILAANAAEGWFLLEDLGTVHLADAYRSSSREAALEATLQTLVRLQSIAAEGIPGYAETRFRDELAIFTDWFVTGLLGVASRPDITGPVFAALVDNTRQQPVCCVHRDWHCRNLLWRPDGTIGVVDFQDALMGPAGYDLASLLYDCYYRFDAAEITHWRDRYLALTPLPIDPTIFPRQLDLLAVQRQLKAIGIFARLWLRDSKQTHLRWILPVVEQLIETCHRHADLVPLGTWLKALSQLASARLASLPATPVSDEAD